ncbi:unnamed protein product [Rotaria magnacalcarata]|nr:unnamed protein product [Rotaria magnacalcarata]CAF1654407.1 unnamed protein product [Rotaria magnacalcarata]CAF2064399.1 unnamed protein product [Rotaria magnacalcarata]CAF2068879.1 unnamed protein product [Rotaria magnacalcarata]CAF3825170.1 unnamed protein product [Rotaria magnacalcarata]
MSNTNVGSEIEGELTKERQNLLEKLSEIFDPETAYDYVWPKTLEYRQQLSLEELRRLNYNQQDENLRRLRSLVHYQTTTQSLSHADLEGAYQSFVRSQVAQHSPRYELERYVRNSSDIDSAKRYVDMANDVLINPQQSLLLFRSSKLNQQKAHLLKQSGFNSLQNLNNDPSLQKYFPERLHNTSRYTPPDEDDFFNNKRDPSRPNSIHMAHNEKKYHIQFLKDYDQHSDFYIKKPNRRLGFKEPLKARHTESLFGSETSTIVPNQSSELNTSNIHRDIFPPLSLSALKEYRPSVTPKAVSTPKSSVTPKITQRRKPMHKSDFIWNQSIVSSATHE